MNRTAFRRSMRHLVTLCGFTLCGFWISLCATSAHAQAPTEVNFDNPAPPGVPGPLDGVFQGVDFGAGQWAWEGPFDVAPTNHVYFSNSTGTSRSFGFSPAPRVLNSVRVFGVNPGTLTLSDDTGQTLTREVTTGTLQLVTTGWKQASTTVTVNYTQGWALGVDDITYAASAPPPNDATPPTVSITSPASRDTVSGTITVTANASDNTAVAGVQLLVDGQASGAEATRAPYVVAWDTTTVGDGLRTLTARARDTAGNVATSTAVTVTVSNASPPDRTPPTVTLTSPRGDAPVSGTVNVTVTASDNVGVARVQFLVDGALAGEDLNSPYSIPWNTALASNGAHTLTARALDAARNEATSAPVTVTVANGPLTDATRPSVAITSPRGGETVTGETVVTANATDNVGVVGVRFLLDGQALGPEDTTAPYQVTWPTTAATNGSHVLTARARDAAGNTATSAAVTVTVVNGSPNDTTPPSVAITSPGAGATVTGTVSVTANATDNVAVVGVQFTLDGAPLGAEDTTAPYGVTWTTTWGTDGAHTLTARARDASGNVALSGMTVTVDNGPRQTRGQCVAAPPRSAITPIPGSTNFNNTVRAQMWINAGTWWGAFSDASSGIYFYRLAGDRFVRGDFIDGNFTAGMPDTLWNGVELFVLVYQSGSLARLYKYRYAADTVTYSLVAGFPVDLPLAGLATATSLHQDSTGRAWVTYTSGRNVHVVWSASVDHTAWNTSGLVLAADIGDFTTEAATIAPFSGDRIGVAWSNQASGEIGFRYHRDVDPEINWSATEIVDCCAGVAGGVADDHLSLKAAPDGRLFLVAKDSIDQGRLHLYVRNQVGVWGPRIRVNPDPDASPTRQALLLDVQNQYAYVIYRESLDDDRLYFSRIGLNAAAFEEPCVFMESPPSGDGRLSDVTSTKQNVDGATGLVAAASRFSQIYGARLDLAAAPPNVVNFDDPAPGFRPGPLDGVFEGIDFGAGQWAWEGPFNAAPSNHIYFSNSTGTSRTFSFSPAPRVLNSVLVYGVNPGTLTLSDDTGQTLTREVAAATLLLITTGWTRASTTVTVDYTQGWALGVDDITFRGSP